MALIIFPSVKGYLATLLVVFACSVLYFLINLYRVRSFMAKLQRQGLPMPPHSKIFGHLLAVKSLKEALPSDASGVYLSSDLSRKFPDSDSIFYLDLWPFSPPFMIVSSPSTCMQAAQQHNLQKPQAFEDLLAPATGGLSLLTMKGEEWKLWRTMFNQGFSTAYLLENISDIVEEVSVFCETLRHHARKGDLLQMEKITVWLTMDIIGKVTLNTRLKSQRGEHPLASALRRQIHWLSYRDEINPWQRWHPLRSIIQWYNGRQMNKFIIKELDTRFEAFRNRTEKPESKQSKSMIDLALENYMTKDGARPVRKMDMTLKEMIARQIRLFLFAGSDSTSSILCYCYYLLSSHPECMARVRAEHDSVFGTDLTAIPAAIVQNPHLLNQIPYTHAVIKEVLRLFPPASSLREGAPGVDIVDPHGRRYPTRGTFIWVIHQALHRNPAYWKRPEDFLPERWLTTDADGDLHPVKGAYRPFELGPQNCIGQNLATLELRCALVMTAREFDIRAAYDQWDDAHAHTRPRASSSAPKTVNGERAYQVGKGGAHPADGFPCQVELFRKEA